MDKKFNNQKGFTLAELLIVVAIIAVLVAIGIPVFAGQLEKSREAVDLSDIRSAYSEVMMAAITGDTSAVYTKDPNQTIYKENGVYSITVSPLKQKQDGWQTASNLTIGGVSSNSGEPYWIGVPTSEGTCIVAYHESEEYVSFEWSGTSSEGGNSNGNGENNSNGGNGETGENGGIVNGSGSSVGEIISSAEPIPILPKTGSIEKGYVYSFKGITYVALTNLVIMNKDRNETPENSPWGYLELRSDATVLTKQDITDGKLLDLKMGMIFKYEDGRNYIRKSDSTHGQEPDLDSENWQEIIYS